MCILAYSSKPPYFSWAALCLTSRLGIRGGARRMITTSRSTSPQRALCWTCQPHSHPYHGQLSDSLETGVSSTTCPGRAFGSNSSCVKLNCAREASNTNSATGKAAQDCPEISSTSNTILWPVPLPWGGTRALRSRRSLSHWKHERDGCMRFPPVPAYPHAWSPPSMATPSMTIGVTSFAVSCMRSA